MLDAVIGYLRCPHCAGSLEQVGSVVRCPSAHAFDVARQGYVNLRGPAAPASTGDSAAMVAARARFLDAGHYTALAETVAAACERAAATPRAPGCVVDIGAGTGHYLRPALDRLPAYGGLALDVSRYALRRAARAHPRGGAVACDVWQSLPVRSGVVDVALSIFAPRNAEEIHRILVPGGAIVVVTPTARHLAELVGPLGMLTVDADKHARLREQLRPWLVEGPCEALELPLVLPHEAVRDLVAMGPTAWHAPAEVTARRVATLPPAVAVTASFVVTVFRRPR